MNKDNVIAALKAANEEKNEILYALAWGEPVVERLLRRIEELEGELIKQLEGRGKKLSRFRKFLAKESRSKWTREKDICMS